MFSWLFSSNTTDADIINNIFYYAINNNNDQVINLLNEHKIDLNSKACKDRYNNTLLHILANGKNIILANHLILCGLRKDCVNVFNEKAVDIALKNNNLAMVRLLSDIEQDPKLLIRIENLENQRNELCDKVEKANEEIINLKKRKLSEVCKDCEDNLREVKRLKTHNDELIKDNKDLQTTVKNLRQQFKK